MPFWDRSLDLIVLTHPDADHLNGLVSVLERYEVALVAETGVESGSAQYASWQALAARAKTETVIAFAGQELSTGDGVVISVLNPPEDVPAWTPDLRNNSGVTLRVSYGEVSFLLPADIHRYTEEVLVASGASLWVNGAQGGAPRLRDVILASVPERRAARGRRGQRGSRQQVRASRAGGCRAADCRSGGWQRLRDRGARKGAVQHRRRTPVAQDRAVKAMPE